MLKGLIQPKDFGDIIALQGLANSLKIDAWPVCEFIYPIMKHFPQFDAIKLRGCNDWQAHYWGRARTSLAGYKIYDTMFCQKRFSNLEYFIDEIKYLEHDIDYLMKYKKFKWIRYQEKENLIYNEVSHVEKYCVVHEYYSNDYKNRQKHPIIFETDLPIIFMRPIPGTTILDWYKVLKNASLIHMIDSGPSNFVDVAGIDVEKHLHLYALNTTMMQPEIKNGFRYSDEWIKHY